jgi:lipopolysaccharide export system permease protein
MKSKKIIERQKLQGVNFTNSAAFALKYFEAFLQTMFVANEQQLTQVFLNYVSGLTGVDLEQLENINQNKRKLAPRDVSSFQHDAPTRLANAMSVSLDTIFQDQTIVSPKANKKIKSTEFSEAQKIRIDSIIEKNNYRSRSATVALNNARTLKNAFNRKVFEINEVEREYRRYQIAWYQKYTTAFACIVMFMIGAPLGAIIKKGGLGMPVLVSIIFFIIYYMLTITGEKWGKEGMANTLLGTWFSILVLIPIGLFFLKQARKDARLFEQEVYMEALKRVKLWIATKFIKNKKTLLNSK